MKKYNRLFKESLPQENIVRGDIKFQKFSKYNRIVIEPTDKVFKEFNIV